MSILNPFSQLVILPPQDNVLTLVEIDFTSTSSGAIYPIPGKCQVVEWGIIISTTFSVNATDPIVKLQRKPLLASTAVDLQSLTLGSSNTKLRKYTTDPNQVAAGGPGTVVVGPSIGGHTTALTADTDLSIGTVVIADTKSMPSVVLTPGDLLVVAVATAATTGGKGIAFVRLEPIPEPYTTGYVNYDAIP